MNITLKLEGDKIVIENLNAMPGKALKMAGKGLGIVAKGVHRDAMDFLNGAGGDNRNTRIGKRQIKKEGIRDGFAKKSGESVKFRLWKDSGGYPVPVRTGNLKRLLDFLEPGETFSNDRGSFTAGKTEVVVFDSARYARVIHEGTGSSAKFGRRPFLHDALQKFNAGDNIVHIVTREIEKGLSR